MKKKPTNVRIVMNNFINVRNTSIRRSLSWKYNCYKIPTINYSIHHRNYVSWIEFNPKIIFEISLLSNRSHFFYTFHLLTDTDNWNSIPTKANLDSHYTLQQFFQMLWTNPFQTFNSQKYLTIHNIILYANIMTIKKAKPLDDQVNVANLK